MTYKYNDLLLLQLRMWTNVISWPCRVGFHCKGQKSTGSWFGWMFLALSGLKWWWSYNSSYHARQP